jgi:hypothetical protein
MINALTWMVRRRLAAIPVLTRVEVQRHLHRARTRANRHRNPATLLCRKHKAHGNGSPDRHRDQSKRHQKPNWPWPEADKTEHP